MLATELPEHEMDFLADHLEVCESCRRRALQDTQRAEVEDDLKWVDHQVRARADMGIPIPLRRISELLPEYEILREIARGGMGVVYEARQINLNRNVALKVLPALLGAVRPDAATRFRREAELTARLKHNNIIAVHDFGEADGTFYYAMELVDGRSLRDILDEIETSKTINVVLGIAGGSSSSPEVAKVSHQLSGGTAIGSAARSDRQYFRRIATWIAEVAEAVHYAHSQGIIHRDIKPSNMILARDGRLMIADFGLARAADQHGVTRTRAIVGTARYMSPEQADPRQGTISQASDVYGLGATLYELLTLRPMFAGQNDVDIIHAVLNKEPALPRRHVRQVPRELETICLKAVEKAPAARYATSQELADDLRRWLLGMPIEARRPNWPTRAVKFAKRRKLAVASGAALAILLAASLYLADRSSRYRADAVAAKTQSDDQELKLIRIDSRRDLEEGKFQSGLERAEKALGRFPEDPFLNASRAFFMNRLGRRDEAIASLAEFVKKHPEAAEVHYMLSSLYSRVTEREKVAEHAALYEKYADQAAPADMRFEMLSSIETDPHKRIELISQAIEANPDNIDYLLTRSAIYGTLLQRDKSLADAQVAAAMRPKLASTHGYLGRALIRSRRPAEAVEAFGRAIELAPNDAQWWSARAVARSNDGQWDAAIFDANRAIELSPEEARAYSCRGKAKAVLGEPGAGIRDCTRALEIEPDNSEHVYDRLCIYKLLGDWAALISDAERFIELRPNDPRGHMARSEALFHRGQFESAIVACTRVLELDPNAARAAHDRGVCYWRLGRLDESVSDFTLAIRIDPTYANAFHHRAIAHWQLDSHSEALADLTRAIELGANGVESYFRRARMGVQLGLFEQAIADCEHVLELSPNTDEARLLRGMSYELLGRRDRAIADYQQVAAGDGPTARYGWLWKHFLQPAPDDAPPSSAAVAGDSQAAPWIDALVAFARGDRSAESLWDVATNDNERAEAHYYIARKAHLDGEKEAARQALMACVDMRRVDVFETAFAVALLARMDQSPSATDSNPPPVVGEFDTGP